MHICENHFHISATNEVPEDTPAALEDKSHTLEDPQAKLHNVLVSTDPVLFARSLLLL